MTCGRAQEFLAPHNLQVSELVDARKRKFTLQEALELLNGVQDIYSVRGKDVAHARFDQSSSEESLKALLLGPHGNLRAPALRVGSVFVVGFDPALYRDALEQRLPAK